MDLLSIKEAANVLEISNVRVFQLIQEGSLPAQKIGRDWFITKNDVESAKSRPGRGRPKKAQSEESEKR